MKGRDEFTRALGARIAQIRISKMMTQRQLAAAIDIDFQSISRIENGRVNSSVYMIKQIADALGIDMPTLFRFDPF